ncbi:MAG: ExbD/TolR family protein [Burkholderiales bacterium]
MRFERAHSKEEPEINLIPYIDVLLVIVIFLSITTTYSRFAELQINLPTADAEKQVERANEINVAVDAGGRSVINKTPVTFSTARALSDELKRAAKVADPTIIINADARASHQSVIHVMEAARLAGYTRITFTTQTPAGS